MTPDNFSRIRQDLELSTKELARKLGFADDHYVKEYETGGRPIDCEIVTAMLWMHEGHSEWFISKDQQGNPYIQRSISPKFIADISGNTLTNIMWVNTPLQGQDADILIAEAKIFLKSTL